MTFNAQLGWVCPKCGRCYAPSVQTCMECKPTMQDVSEIVLTCKCGSSVRICPLHGGAYTAEGMKFDGSIRTP